MTHCARRHTLPVGLAVLLASCSHAAVSDLRPAASQGDEATPPETGRLNEGQIVHVLDVLDSEQVTQARVGVRRASDSRVRDLARRMGDEHEGAKRDTAEVARTIGRVPEQSALAERLQERGNEALTFLEQSGAARLDVTYLDRQVRRHAELLRTLDEELMPAVRSSALAARLGAERRILEDHRDEVRELYAALSPFAQPARTSAAP